MTRRVRPLLLISIQLLLSLASAGQTNPPGFSVTNYTSDNALPQNSINAMAFDRNGFLWLATEMGLVRFDGRNFREYNSANSPLLLSNRCAGISLERSSGRIILEPEFSNHHILTVTDNYQLEVDSALSNPWQMNLRDNNQFSFAHLYKKWAAGNTSAFGGLFNGLENNGDFLTVNNSQAYVTKDQRYYFLDEHTAGVRPLSEIAGHAMKVQFIIGDVYILIDKQNHLYAYKDGNRQPVAGSTRLLDLLRQIDVKGAYLMQAKLRALRDTCHTFFAYKGNILLLSLHNGLVDFDTLAANTSITSINCLIYDQRNKILYVGTATSGLYILKKQEFQRFGFTSDNYAINSLYAQVELSDGRLLTSSGILDPRNKINTPTPGIYDRQAIFRSSDDSIWYSSYGYVRKSDTGLHHSSTVQAIGLGSWLASFVETPGGDVLFCSRGFLYRWHRGKTTLLLDRSAWPEDTEIYVLELINPNELWIGTSAGLFSYDLSHATLGFRPELGKATVRAIHKARDGGIWIGTYGQGFYKYTGGRFIRMPADPGNNLATVHCFMEDKQGYFWLPTNKGLYRVPKNDLDRYAAGDRKNVFYYYFDKPSGFTSNEFNGGCTPCGIVTRDGRFSLPSLDGLIQFRPDSLAIMAPDRPIFIDRLAANEKTVLPPGYFKQAQDAGPLVFAVSSPYFGNPANLHLEYSIPELDNKWHPVSGDGRLVLTGLGKGRFTLTIRKQESFARYTCKTIGWTILPFWYETIWFRLLAALILVTILPLIFWLRYKRQVKKAQLLEQKVAERTEALSESNRVKEKMIAIILHDLRSPLRFLHMMAVHVYENYQQVPRPELGEMLGKFRNATHDLYEFAQDFLLWTNVQKAGFVVRQERIALREIVGEIVSLYEPGADIRNNNVLNLVSPDVTLFSDPHILKLIIRNLTDNATKYTLDGEIKIEASQDGSATRLTISDTGRSMEKELIAEILSNTYQADDNNQGFGYKIILELLGKIGGELSIDTPGNTGNRITLLFQAARA